MLCVSGDVHRVVGLTLAGVGLAILALNILLHITFPVRHHAFHLFIYIHSCISSSLPSPSLFDCR